MTKKYRSHGSAYLAGRRADEDYKKDLSLLIGVSTYVRQTNQAKEASAGLMQKLPFFRKFGKLANQ